MAIRLEIGLEQLSAPGVAEALARLVGALQGDPQANSVIAAQPQVQAPVAPPAQAPAPAPAPAAPPPRPARKPAPELQGSETERYAAFMAKLPERSRNFIELVRTRKLLKISDAMRELGLTAPKAMGGLTGSIGRWAPIRGVKIPYETTTADGERAWRWLGAPGEIPAAAPSAPAGYTPTGLPAAVPPVAVVESDPPAPVKAPKPAKASKSAKAAKPEPVEPAPAPVEPAPAPAPAKSDAPSLRDFAELPEKSQQFITLVAARGLITRKDALEALGLRRPKELGGVTEPIMRLCRDKGIERPYLAGRRNGKRVWLWPTIDVPDDVELS